MFDGSTDYNSQVGCSTSEIPQKRKFDLCFCACRSGTILILRVLRICGEIVIKKFGYFSNKETGSRSQFTNSSTLVTCFIRKLNKDSLIVCSIF